MAVGRPTAPCLCLTRKGEREGILQILPGLTKDTSTGGVNRPGNGDCSGTGWGAGGGRLNKPKCQDEAESSAGGFEALSPSGSP